MKQRGLSLFRLQYMDEEFQTSQASAICQIKPGECFEKILVSDASRIRSLVIPNEVQALAVLDDPAPEAGTVPANDAHAIAVAKVEMNEEDLLMIRTELQLVFT
ncbi:hypothetical protein [Paracoccus indicus]|uniref:hypothetical protein n=1 Tax=Paracoccus indicus TaxID=2079229 RepID=UPI0013B37DE1|nr:hypothetical protein [Paracoccus indicus]